MQACKIPGVAPRLTLYQTLFTGPLRVEHPSAPDEIHGLIGVAPMQGVSIGEPTVIEAHRPQNHPDGRPDYCPVMVTSPSVRSVLHDFIFHTWRLVQQGQRKPKTLTAYASMTGIVPDGFRLQPKALTGERNFGAIYERGVRDLTAHELRLWMLDLVESIREGSPYLDEVALSSSNESRSNLQSLAALRAMVGRWAARMDGDLCSGKKS